MEDRNLRLSRRKFLRQAAALTLATGMPQTAAAAGETPGLFRARPPKPGTEGRKPIAVVATVYRPLAHCDHIAGRFIQGYPRDGQFHVPRSYVHSMYVDQVPENDQSRGMAKDFGFQLTRSVADALTGGTDKLTVDGVLVIGEHGNYPRNNKGQILYPRFEMMEQSFLSFAKPEKPSLSLTTSISLTAGTGRNRWWPGRAI